VTILGRTKKTDIVGPQEFFNRVPSVPRETSQPTVQLNRLSAVDHGRPRFFHNREEGNFDES
jgi:hypothetical protein